MKLKTQQNIKRLKLFLGDNKRKGLFTILYEVFVLCINNKGFPFYYFGRLVYRIDSGNFKDYLSTKKYFSIINSKKLNSDVFNSLMGNKLFFSMFCKKNNLPIS